MENSCRVVNTKAFKALQHRIEIAAAAGIISADYHLDLFKAMNPKSMSPADISMLNEFQEIYP